MAEGGQEKNGNAKARDGRKLEERVSSLPSPRRTTKGRRSRDHALAR